MEHEMIRRTKHQPAQMHDGVTYPAVTLHAIDCTCGNVSATWSADEAHAEARFLRHIPSGDSADFGPVLVGRGY